MAACGWVVGRRGAISIEINPAYTKEARERIASEFGEADEEPDMAAAD